MKKFLCISLLLVCLLVVFSACGEGTPAETTGEVTTQPMTGEATTQAVTTVQTTEEVTTQPAITTGLFVGPASLDLFDFHSLSDFYLYMEENPSDHTRYEEPVWIPGNYPFPGKLIRVKEILPSLVDSEQYFFSQVMGMTYFQPAAEWFPYYVYCYRPKDEGDGSVSLSIDKNIIEFEWREEDYVQEWDEELECLLIKEKETGKLRLIAFYSLEGYTVNISFGGNVQEGLLSSDVTELKEILENPTFSCERLRIISETLRAMND